MKKKLDSWLQYCFKTPLKAIITVVLFVMLTANASLFSHIAHIYPLNVANLPFLVSLAAFFTLLTTLFFIVVSFGRPAKWLIAVLLILSAQTAYYMDTFGVLFDTVMIDNMLHTDTKEAAGLFNLHMLLQVSLLGVLPAWLVIRYWPVEHKKLSGISPRLKWLGITFLLLILVIAPFTAGYTSFIREHKIARFYANPTYPVYSLVKFFTSQFGQVKHTVLKIIAGDATSLDQLGKHELIIFVVGETARFDRFSLNGYKRITNPRLAKENVVSLSNVSSCGTSTGVSVPCMFSNLGRKNYDKEKALNQENILDVLAKKGIEVLWRDNNSDSKGVATRVPYEDFKSPTMNPVCDSGECRDVGMLSGLDEFIAKRKNKDIIIVLHQMGNHGPEYYRRYPKNFEQFKPMCMTGELRDCKQQEIDNSYDNAILYTDYFLSEVIQFLKKYDDQRETAMLYVSDHGESLGEHGIYLHAAPYMIAPKEQTHVPAIVWMGKHFDFQISQLKPYQHYPLSHDDVFCSLLVGFELESHTCLSKNAVLMENLDIKAQIQLLEHSS